MSLIWCGESYYMTQGDEYESLNSSDGHYLVECDDGGKRWFDMNNFEVKV